MQQKTIELFSEDKISYLKEIIESFEKEVNAKVTSVTETMQFNDETKKLEVCTKITFQSLPVSPIEMNN